MASWAASVRATLVVGLLSVVSSTTLVSSTVAAKPVPESERVERTDPVPKQLQGVEVNERLGQVLPKTLGFRDHRGNDVVLGQYFDGKHPVILTLNYSNCPMLCSLQLSQLVNSLKQVAWGVNRDYRVVTVSLEPNEPLELQQRTESRYLTQYGRPEARGGWAFLSGSSGNVRAYADAIGFSYRYVDERKEFAHPAAIVLAAPDGTIVRYLYGLQYDTQTLRLALTEASRGEIGSTIDKLILYCFHYDSSQGRYAPVAQKIMKLAGAVSVVLLAGFLFVMRRSEGKRKRQLLESTAT
ncbi:MAG TPA: SCO family protein [Polyangiaceae bacterium]|nr:SCO family protein [Polyangiaceae bacterium]